MLEEAIECTDNPLWNTKGAAETMQATESPALEARGWDLEGLEMSCPALADIATTSIAEAVKAEAAANFGQALALLQQARIQLLTALAAAESDVHSSPMRREAIQEALAELEQRIQALTEAVQTGLRAAGLRCPLFARGDNDTVPPPTEMKSDRHSPVQTPGPARSRFTPESHKKQPQTPQERRLRMEEVNASRKRLEAAAGALSGAGTPPPELVEKLLATGESFGSTLRNQSGLKAAVAHLERAVEIMRYMPQKTIGVKARADAFDTACDILRAAARI